MRGKRGGKGKKIYRTFSLSISVSLSESTSSWSLENSLDQRSPGTRLLGDLDEGISSYREIAATQLGTSFVIQSRELMFNPVWICAEKIKIE
jgi:hypothetical protein